MNSSQEGGLEERGMQGRFLEQSGPGEGLHTVVSPDARWSSGLGSWLLVLLAVGGWMPRLHLGYIEVQAGDRRQEAAGQTEDHIVDNLSGLSCRQVDRLNFGKISLPKPL